MAGQLSGTPHREGFRSFLVRAGLGPSSAASYVSYINDLCRNMAAAEVHGAGADNALEVLLACALAAKTPRDLLDTLGGSLEGPGGRPSNLRAAAARFHEYAWEQGGGGSPADRFLAEEPSPGGSGGAGNLELEQIEWLRDPPSPEVQEALRKLFAQVFQHLTGRGDGLRRRAFDEALRNALISGGCRAVSALDAHLVLPDAKYTVDLSATTSGGTRLLLEIEKTEVKRIAHDLLKLAAGQKVDPEAVGLLVVPARYRTGKKEFARTHLQEARAVMGLLDYSHPWQGGAVGVVVYR
jgi:hypothetical protein